MGQDAVALVRIRRLRAPSRSGVSVVHLRDCSLVSTGDRMAHFRPDEHAVRLRRLLGAALDAHDDPRGILFFSDAWEPRGDTYDALVRELKPWARDWGKWNALSSRRLRNADRVLRALAAERRIDAKWLAARLRAGAKRDARAELEDFILEITNALVDDHQSTDEDGWRDAVDMRVRAWAAGGPPLSPARPRRPRGTAVSNSGGAKAARAVDDPDVAEMIRLFGGDAGFWSEALRTEKRR